jgi:hypothetical protein
MVNWRRMTGRAGTAQPAYGASHTDDFNRVLTPISPQRPGGARQGEQAQLNPLMEPVTRMILTAF